TSNRALLWVVSEGRTETRAGAGTREEQLTLLTPVPSRRHYLETEISPPISERMLHGFHLKDEVAEERPILTVAVNTRPEILALPASQSVVSEHVVGNLLAHHARIHHERDFLEEAKEVALLFKGNVPQPSMIVLRKIANGL